MIIKIIRADDLSYRETQYYISSLLGELNLLHLSQLSLYDS